jgi:hypothetical protein
MILALLLEDSEKLFWLKKAKENREAKDRSKNEAFFDSILSRQYDGRKYYSIGYNTESRGSSMSLEDATNTAKKVREKFDINVLVCEIALGNWGSDDTTSFIAMTSPLISAETIKKSGIRYEQGGNMSSGGFSYSLGGL